MTIRKMSNIERDSRARQARSRKPTEISSRNHRSRHEEEEEEPEMLKQVASKLKMFGSKDEDELNVHRTPSRESQRPSRDSHRAKAGSRRREEDREDHSRRWKIIIEDRIMTDVHEFVFLESVGIGRKHSEMYDQYLVVNDPRVSGVHCVIMSRGGKLYLKDEGSKNHTYLNGERIDKPEVIQKEDIISLGESRLEILKIMRET